jgi:hypothetical protein
VVVTRPTPLQAIAGWHLQLLVPMLLLRLLLPPQRIILLPHLWLKQLLLLM